MLTLKQKLPAQTATAPAANGNKHWNERLSIRRLREPKLC
jgi:hypothetical protein